MADDRYSRLLAAITARRELAEATMVHTKDQGCWSPDSHERGSVWRDGLHIVAQGMYPEDTRHVAANDPAQILRDTAAHLRIVERHQHRGGPGDNLCRCCKEWWPCPDWLDVASSYPETEARSCA